MGWNGVVWSGVGWSGVERGGVGWCGMGRMKEGGEHIDFSLQVMTFMKEGSDFIREVLKFMKKVMILIGRC